MKKYVNKVKNFYEKDKRRKIFYTVAVLFLLINGTRGILGGLFPPDEPKEIAYTEFKEMVKDEKVASVELNLRMPTFEFKDKNKQVYVTDNPKTEDFKASLLEANVKVKEIDASASEQWASLLRAIIPLVFIIILIIYMSKSMNPGKSKKKNQAIIPDTVFDHIAGNEESKEEMKFLVEFLKKPKRFTKMGAKLPKGVILYGEPGTGKTLTAKAIAGEAGVPFFALSGSDFTEMFVGVGPSRVRALFEEARKKAPSIIFIDEVDALGSNRDISMGSEDKKTLNAILNELDGFTENSGVVVIGATNRLEDLDPAFIRPGRFDKHIAVTLPDKKGRLAILNLHAKNKKLAKDVNLENLAKITLGMSGAYLETILNEATILATIRDRDEVTEEDIDDAYYKMIVKGHKKKIDETQKRETEIIAWHEAGHALLAKLLDTSDVPKVTITPSTTGIGGFALITPKKESLQSRKTLEHKVMGLYAGRIAEKLFLNDDRELTVGASNDIEKATHLIRSMILNYGMSHTFGMINLAILDGQKETSLADNILFVDEATKLSKQLYREATRLLQREIVALEAIATRLIENETILEDELEQIIATHRTKQVEPVKELVTA